MSSSDSEDQSSSESYQMSETESEEDYETHDMHVFKIGNKRFKDFELTKLVKSTTEEDKTKLNEIVRLIMKGNLTEVFEYLLFRGYKIDPMNDEGQTAVHLLFYDECKNIIERQKLKGLSKKAPAFGSLSADNKMSSMSFMSAVFFRKEHHNLFAHSELLLELIQNWLVERKLNLTSIDDYGLTYMHIACLVGEKNLVKKCLKNGLDVNARFNDPEVLYKNYTPLHFGVLNPLLDTDNIVDTLLKNGADVEARDLLGRTPLHLACRLFHNPSNFHIDDSIQKKVKQESLAQCIIVRPGKFYAKNAYIVEALLKKNSDVNAKDNAGNSPLLSIFPEKYNDELSRFRDEWYDFGVPIQETTLKFTYLMQAGADVTLANENGDTILHLVTRNLKRWRNSSDYLDIKFDDSYHTEMIRTVLQSCPQMNVNVENNLGETPLQLAVECISFDIVKLLWKSGADLNTLKFSRNLFCYPNIAPNFDAVRNLVSIAELFESNNFKFTDNAYLEVLRFLIHCTNECQCTGKNYRHYALFFASEYHIRNVLYRIPVETYTSSSDEDSDEESDNDNQYKDIVDYLDLIYLSNSYINTNIETKMKILTDYDYPGCDDSSKASIRKELRAMHATRLDVKFTVYNVITNHPYNIPRDAVKNFDSKLVSKFTTFRDLVTGNIAKATIRYYVTESAGRYVKALLPSLPDESCQIIISYLSNETILKVCVAMSTQDLAEKRLLVKV